MRFRTFVSAVVCAAGLAAQTAPQASTPKEVREIAKARVEAIPQLQALLKNPGLDIRLEAVKQMIDIGGPATLDPLVEATADNDPEIQIRATDGLVNFYLPGYVRDGIGASLRRVGTNIKARFTDVNDQVIDPYIQVRPDVISALGKLARGGVNMSVRANAARAIGVLRGKPAVPDLIAALKSKDSDVIYESLNALQKIRDESAAPQIAFLMNDLDEKVQIAAIETTGLLQNAQALPDLTRALNRARSSKVRRAALSAIAMVPDESSRPLFAKYIDDRDDRMRAAAAEGYGRLKNPADRPLLEKAFQEENKTAPRISLAFALVLLGSNELSENSPLQYLVNTLNSSAWRGEAYGFLVEAARAPAVRTLLYAPLASGTKDERIYLARVLGRSGDKDSVARLEQLSHDSDSTVAEEGLRALRSLKARL
jgi:HEAT repeat protein